MKMNRYRWAFCVSAILPTAVAAADDESDDHLQLKDVFELEYASDPRIAPDGESIIYVRNFMDIMNDARRSNLWAIRFDGSEHRPITTGHHSHSSPRFSPDGKRWMQPPAGELRAPRIAFVWGPFRFLGVIETLDEDWIRFDADGTPVRGWLSLVMRK